MAEEVLRKVVIDENWLNEEGELIKWGIEKEIKESAIVES